MADLGDPLMRASLWNTVRGNVHNAVLPLDEALTLVERALPAEDDETGVQQVGLFAVNRLVGLGSGPRRVGGRACTARRSSGWAAQTPPAAVSSVSSRPRWRRPVTPSELRGWLASRQLPTGLELDRDLRWRILTRLAVIGGTDAAELQERLDENPDAESTVDHARARASLPDADAKAWAWRRFVGEESVPELRAGGDRSGVLEAGSGAR